MCYSREELLSYKPNQLPHIPNTLFNKLAEHGIRKTYRGVRGGCRLQRNIKPVIGRRIPFPHSLKQTGINHSNLCKIKCDPTFTQSSKMAKCALFNAQSVCNKTEFIVDYIVEHEFDLVAVTETWMNENDSAVCAALKIPGYKYQHKPRIGQIGGGVGIFFKESWNCSIQKSRKMKSFEHMCIKLSNKTMSLDIVLLYRPQRVNKVNVSTSVFFQELEDMLTQQLASGSKLLLLGDFNFHINMPNDNDGQKLLQLLSDLSLIQHVTGPTHSNGNTLDLVITHSEDALVSNPPVLDTFISDHRSIIFQLQIKKAPPVQKTVSFRKIRSINIEAFKSDIANSDLCKQPKTSLPDLVDQYSKTLTDCLDIHAPLLTKTITIRPAVTWYTEECSEAKRRRRALERKWLSTESTADKALHDAAKNSYNVLLEKSKVSDLNGQIIEAGSDQRKQWQLFTPLLNREKSNPLPHTDSLEQLVEEFNCFYQDKIERIRQDLSNTSAHRPTAPNTQTNEPLTCELTQFKLLTQPELIKLIAASPTKSCELDPIPTKLLKECTDELIFPLLHIVNLSLETGTFPDPLKHSIIKPLLKKANLEPELKNYRPVSNLTYVSKLIERAVNNQLVSYLTQNGLDEKLQSAYKKYNSTETALMKIHNDIIGDLDNQKVVLLVMLDLSAAFDTVDHHKLTTVLESIGIKGSALMWIKSYLSDRKQAVRIGNCTSELKNTRYGVPQGSVLGPVLFNIYTSGLGFVIRGHGVDYHFYADDSTLYIRVIPRQQECDDACEVISMCISDIQMWMLENFLKLNGDKTEFLLIGLPQQLKKITIPHITVGDDRIQPVDDVRLLGAQLDKNLSMTCQVTKLCQSLGYVLHNIAKIRKYLTTEACKTLVHALFTSKLDLNNSLLTGIPKNQIRRLQLLQNTAARIIMRKSKDCHITPVLKELHWLPVAVRIKYKIAVMVYKCLHDMAPQYLCELISVRKIPRSLRSSASTQLVIPQTKIKTGERAFSVSGPIVWNKLPSLVRSAQDITDFKSKLKTYLFMEYFS